MINVLSIGTDRTLFDEMSEARRRTLLYGQKLEALHIIIYTGEGFAEKKIAENVWLYPTNSRSRWFYVWDAVCIGKRLIRRNKFSTTSTCITTQDPFECGLAGARLSRRSGIPLHVQIHTDFLSPYFNTSLLQWVRVKIATHVLSKARGIRVVSKRIADSLLTLNLSTKPDIIPIRPDREMIEGTQTIDVTAFGVNNSCILMASRLTPEKNIEDGIRAFDSIKDSHPDVSMIIAGEGSEKELLVALVHDLGLSSRIHFLGWRNDLPGIMKSATIFLSTSAFEGYGLSLVTSGLCRTPVVTTDVGIVGESIIGGENALVCPVGDVTCLGEKLDMFLSDRAHRLLYADRLYEQINRTMPTEEEYVTAYIRNLERTLQ